jgi:hypothetical protein
MSGVFRNIEILNPHHLTARRVCTPKPLVRMKDTLAGCGVAHRVRCGSDSSAPACCAAGPGSNLGSAPQRKAMRTTRVVLYE